MLNLWATINRIVLKVWEDLVKQYWNLILNYSRGSEGKMRLGQLNNEVGLEVLISQDQLLGEADYVDV